MSEKKPIWDYDWGLVARFGLVLLMLAFSVSGLFTMMGYLDYSKQVTYQEACEEQFGPHAEYVGETGGLGADSALICIVDGQREYMRPPIVDTAGIGDYIQYLVSSAT